MSKPIIQVEGIGKSYKISHELKASMGNVSIRDGINNIVRKPIELITGHRMRQEKFWALKDINFDIEQGEVVGIIGKNGSGKSTLLKIMSRITEPTTGEIRMHGRVASLLEVGTGFHPELTGRENVYFNGSILGMRKKEIESKFDEIVAFSEVEKFLDTPVKFYSSGMYVRLAFAVAAHLDPDILIVDEVLAVGDTAFQKKCLNKMRDVAGGGKTVLFVSHSMDSVKSLCEKVIFLENGQIKALGKTDEIIDKYMADANKQIFEPIAKRTDRTGTGKVKCVEAEIQNNIKESQSMAISLSLDNSSGTALQNIKLSLDIYDESGNFLCNMQNGLVNKKLDLTPGINKLSVKVTGVNLVAGKYYLNTFVASDIANTEIFDWVEGAAPISVPEYDFYNVGEVPFESGKFVYLNFEYEE